MQQKLQGIVQLIEAEPLEHVHFDRVEQLVAQAEEVVEKVARVKQIVKTFQDKVCPPVQTNPMPAT